ncbi:MAG: glutamate--tRNA ligase [Ruminococcaceae bacterium]|nr:glutamate--tRNA ligase [Oscillospiraceae bacterium]
MNFNYLADLLFPNVSMTPEELEAKYPERSLPEGAKVTRFAPSPTGFVHFGGMFPVTVGERLAHQSGGVFYLRIEDTDAKREVEGAADALIETLAHYGVTFDEGAVSGGDRGDYGPYRQSERAAIYHVYAKKLVRDGRAYPVFSTDEELSELAAADKKAQIKSTDWEATANARREAMIKRREFTIEGVEEELKKGHKFALFAIADGDSEKKIKFTDLVRGTLEIPENDEDVVLLKSDGIPTYHFAHAVDDHLMRTTHVVRGEEWLPSLSKHLMLFRYLGFRAPKYMHISQIMRLDDEGNKKKLSKRDMGANMDDYKRLGYAPACVNEYVMTLLNSSFEEWRMANTDKPIGDYQFNIKKMSASGCLFDIVKLSDVSKNVISRMTADEVFSGLYGWAAEFDPEFAAELKADPELAKAIVSIGRGGKKPRKDYGTWVELRDYMKFFYDRYFSIEDQYPEKFDKKLIASVLSDFLDSYDHADTSDIWFGKVKAITDKIGFASDMKAYKANPDAFGGNVADVSMFIRVAVTGKQNAPDLYTVMHILGRERSLSRIKNMITDLTE